MTKALVLSGGGPVGIAWESGLIGGLAKAGIDLSDADFILGTSAGAFVGSRLATGTTPEQLAAPFLAMSDAAPPALPATSGEAAKPPPNAAALFTRMEEAHASGKPMQAVLRDVGVLALQADTVSEADFIKSFGREFNELADDFWPERGFACTAIDAETGEFRLWGKGDGAGLTRAVASSCSVPGIFPPITINGRRYIDGGVRSGGNADYAKGHDLVVIVAIRIATEGPMAERVKRSLDEEIRTLTDAGSRVELLYPDTASVTAFGPNLMDARRRPGAAKAGYAQGLAGSEALKKAWAAH